MELIDSHCHLDDDRFDGQRDEVLARAAAAGISSMVIPATTANRWNKIKQICTLNKGFYPAYGLHPWFVEQHQLSHLRELDEWLDREQPVAVGECGLDFYQSRADEQWQRRLLVEQLQLANNHALPVIVHARKAMDDVISLLRRHATHAGVVHSFAGSQQQARQLYDLGFKLGIAASVSFERANKLRTVVATMPDDALLLESDAPDQPGTGHRGEYNEPAYIVEHLQVMADLRHCEVEDLATRLNHNAKSLFGI